MMNWNFTNTNNVTQDQINSQQQEESEGKTIWEQLQNKSLSCQSLTNDQYDLLGEYLMGQSIGDIKNHVIVDERMKAMMGENGETQVHINWGRTGSGCFNGQTSSMMGYSPVNFTGPNTIFIFGTLTWILVLVVLALASVWFFKQIRKK